MARIVELDGLRGIAILSVIGYHFWPEIGPMAAVRPLWEVGWSGVDLFFVLSGFLITGILLNTRGKDGYFRNFWVRRVLRIFPLYYVCLAAFPLLASLLPDYWQRIADWGGPGWFVPFAGNLRIAWMREYPDFWLFGPLWSLQVEEQFYLFYPALVAVVSNAQLKKILTACVIVAPVLRCAGVVADPTLIKSVYVLTPCRMDALALGGLLALAHQEGTLARYRRQWKWAAWGGLAISGLILSQINRLPLSPFNITLGFTLYDMVFSAVVAAVLTHLGPSVNWLRWRPLVYTGQIAFGLYLVHGPVEWCITYLLIPRIPGGISETLRFGLLLAGSFGLAAASWELFERRILALKSRFAPR